MDEACRTLPLRPPLTARRAPSLTARPSASRLPVVGRTVRTKATRSVTATTLAVLAALLGAGCTSGIDLVGDGDDARPGDADDAAEMPESDAVADDDTELDSDADVETDACALACVGRECGDDGCGGTCGPGCGSAETCTPDGFCQPSGESWVGIPDGTFLMGSPSSEAGRDSDESQHLVTLTHPFLVNTTEVTQAQFTARMGYNPSSYGDCPTCSVNRVTWDEAVAYSNAMSAETGRAPCYWCEGTGSDIHCVEVGPYPTLYDCPGYRLPTEAEWEYAARAGDTRATYNGDLDAAHLNCEAPNAVLDPIAWFCGNDPGGFTTPPTVATKRPNAWGLYDMLGGVWEWCVDRWDGSDYDPGSAVDPIRGDAVGRVYRSGCWVCSAEYARAAARSGWNPDAISPELGFRVARSLLSE
jgi:formylglycine-generating enzyme required for sulfatase activity